MNKTLLRAMKRYYFTEFDSIFGFSSFSKKEKFSSFHELVREYITKEMKTTATLTQAEQEEAMFFFGSMISHIHMRRGITISKKRTQVNSVHKCLYNYSHKKLAQLIEVGGFKFILEDFVTNGLDVVLNGEETMLKQQEVYREACETLFLKTQQ